MADDTISKKVVKNVGDAVVEAYEQGKRLGKKLNKDIVEPVIDELARGAPDVEGAEKEARVMQRAAELKRQHPKVPAGKAIQHARNEEEAGLLKK